MEKRLANYRFNRTKQRIGSFLKELATHEGQILLNGEILIPLDLTHEMIAEMVAVSRQLVTVTLNQWSKAGIVRYKRRRLTVIKPEML
jgi:CRP-like cAMP-binding protein